MHASPLRSLGLRPHVIAALLPPVVLAVIIGVHRVPESVRANSVPLSGEWSLRHGDGVDGAGAAVPQEGPWLTRQLPDTVDSPALEGVVTWLKRSVEVPANLRSDALYLRLGGVRSGSFKVFWNGQLIAEEFVLGGKEGWQISPALVRGDNDLAIRVQWAVVGDYGFDEARWMIGKASLLEPFFERGNHVAQFVYSGVLFTLPFAFVLIWVLRLQDPDAERRSLYASILIFLPSFAVYLGFMTTSLLPSFFDTELHLPLLLLTVAGANYGVVSFSERYTLKRLTWFGRFNRWACGVPAALNVVFMLAGSSVGILVTYLLFMAYSFGAAGYIIVLFIIKRERMKETQGLGYILMSGLIFYMVAGMADITMEMHLHYLPRLFPLSMSNLVIAVLCVVITDFVRIAETNKGLTISLKKTNADLSVALVEAKEAARVKGEFVANMSHELRTPLNSILNVPTSLMETFSRGQLIVCAGCRSEFAPDGDEVLTAETACPECSKQGTLAFRGRWQFLGDARDSMRRMQGLWRSAMHLLNLVDGVLDFSKINASRMTLQVKLVPVRDVLLGVAATIGNLAEAKKITLNVVEPSELFEINGDPARMSQILMNLAGNALKFTPEGGTIELGAEKKGDVCHLWVKDDGIGVPASSHQLIFESFRQIDSSHTRPYGGTGLGLAIAKALVELHDGKIWVASEDGRGATFHVELPIAGPGAKPEVLLAAKGETLRRVFVATDDALALNAIRFALHPLGVNVTGTSELARLVEMIGVQQPDLLILDVVGAQEESPVAVCERAGSAPRSSERPMSILALNVSAPQEAALRAVGAHTLAAPWKTEELSERVMQLLGITLR